jgi:serine protease Do
MNRTVLGFAVGLALAISGTAPCAELGPASAIGWSNADLTARVLPAVVSISVEKIVKLPGDSGRGRRESFFGSGFIIDPSGLIVTNRHVIEGAAWITVSFKDRSQASAELIAACGLTDLALLKVDVADLCRL